MGGGAEGVREREAGVASKRVFANSLERKDSSGTMAG